MLSNYVHTKELDDAFRGAMTHYADVAAWSGNATWALARASILADGTIDNKVDAIADAIADALHMCGSPYHAASGRAWPDPVIDWLEIFEFDPLVNFPHVGFRVDFSSFDVRVYDGMDVLVGVGSTLRDALCVAHNALSERI